MNRRNVRKCAPLGGTFGLIALGMALPARATNLLLNPGFESPAAGGSTSTVCTGWTFSNTVDIERATFFNHTTPTGAWSLWEQNFQTAGSASQTVTNGIVGGSSYSLSCYYYFEGNYPAGTISDLEMTWLDSTGTPTGTPVIDSIDGSTQPLNAWDQFTISGMAPANTAQIEVSFGFTNGQNTGLNGQSAFVDDADLEGAGAVNSNAVWAIDGSGDWNASGDWSTGTIPNGAGAEADFLSSITANHNVFTDIAVTAGTLSFNNTNTYVIDGAGSLTLQAATGNAQVIVQAGTQEINLPLTIASNTVFNVSSGATLVIGNPMTINAGESVTTTGTGTVTYQSIINVGAGASIAFANSTHANALNLVSGATASIATHSGSTPTILQLDNLSNSGLINVTNNDMIVHNGNLATITSEIAQGFAGDWHGTTGITSSAAATSNNKALGVELATTSTFEGQSVTAGKDVLVKYTYYGDSNLDGQVTAADYIAIDNGFNTHSTGWANGDYNYDGVVNGDDYTLIDNAFNTQGGVVIAAAPAQSLATDTAQIAGAPSSAVPEPATFSMLGIAAAGLMLRRRRSEK